MKSDKDPNQVELNGFKKKIMTEQDKQIKITNTDWWCIYTPLSLLVFMLEQIMKYYFSALRCQFLFPWLITAGH